MDLSRHIALYLSQNCILGIEVDALFLQMCVVVLGAEEALAQILVRYSYIPQKDRDDPQTLPMGYPHFLWLVNCLVSDCPGLSPQEEETTMLRRRVLERLATKPRPRSSIKKRVRQEDDEGDDASGLAFDERLSVVLAEVTAVEKHKDGNYHSIKNPQLWAEIQPYQLTWDVQYE